MIKIIFFILAQSAMAIDWIALHKTDYNGQICDQLDELSPIQKRICIRYPKLMDAILTASKQTKRSCTEAMHDQRWNCESLKYAPDFKRDLRKGTSERAYVHALSSAAVSINIAKRCSMGDIQYCGCRARPTDRFLDKAISRPCEHDLEWANQFSKEWTDAPIYRSNAKKRYQIMYTHDNSAGRQVALQTMQHICKCHGVSGSCTEKTCWKVTPSVDQVSIKLKNLYSKSIQVPRPRLLARDLSFNKVALSTSIQMVYVDESSNYCDKNQREGSEGTKGRECNPHRTGDGSCDSLCCGRGFIRKEERILNTQHNCRYVWCCRVECDTVTELKVKYLCK